MKKTEGRKSRAVVPLNKKKLTFALGILFAASEGSLVPRVWVAHVLEALRPFSIQKCACNLCELIFFILRHSLKVLRYLQIILHFFS
jgi:hypothetical protein